MRLPYYDIPWVGVSVTYGTGVILGSCLDSRLALVEGFKMFLADNRNDPWTWWQLVVCGLVAVFIGVGGFLWKGNGGAGRFGMSWLVAIGGIVMLVFGMVKFFDA